MSVKKPDPIDVHVGGRVRLRRMLLGISQEKLGYSLGITFQQVQKYEKGVNRIGASRLHNIAKLLDVPVTFFFEDIAEPGNVTALGAGEAEPEYLHFVNTREGLELNRAFTAIEDPRQRKAALELIRSMAAPAALKAVA